MKGVFQIIAAFSLRSVKRTDKGKGFELSPENQRISRTRIAVAHILNLTRLWQGTDIVESVRVTH